MDILKSLNIANPKVRKFVYLGAGAVLFVLGAINLYMTIQADIHTDFVTPSWWNYVLSALAFIGVNVEILAVKNLPKTLEDIVNEALSEEEALAGVENIESQTSTEVKLDDTLTSVELALTRVREATVGKIVGELMVEAHKIESSSPMKVEDIK